MESVEVLRDVLVTVGRQLRAMFFDDISVGLVLGFFGLGVSTALWGHTWGWF